MVAKARIELPMKRIEEFCRKYGLAEFSLFGSVLSDDFGPTSDVDVMISLKPGQTMTAVELQSFCRGKIMDYKIPHYAKFVDDFPKTVTGKIQKYKMRELSVAELGLNDVKKAA